MAGYLIRRMHVSDVEAVTRLDELCIPTPWSEATFMHEATNEFGAYFVLAVDETLVGYIGGQVVEDEAHIFTLGVHPESRGRGLGERLLLHFLRFLKPRGVVRVTLEVRESNDAARRLYRKWGFERVSRRRQYYPDNCEDAIVMWVADLQALSLHSPRREASDASPGD